MNPTDVFVVFPHMASVTLCAGTDLPVWTIFRSRGWLSAALEPRRGAPQLLSQGFFTACFVLKSRVVPNPQRKDNKTQQWLCDNLAPLAGHSEPHGSWSLFVLRPGGRE